MKIAIAGAFGFIGQHLVQCLLAEGKHEIVAITRSSRESEDPRVHCVAADLYCQKETTAALAGCDMAVYLVHSMAPGARLSQGHFRDFDYVLADNFQNAAAANRIQQIIYVGGMIPSDIDLSPHLESRLEVEEVLRSQATPVTSIRCGIVIGQKASSFSIIVRLVERLPLMVLPQWMRTRSNPIFVGDLAKIVAASINHPIHSHRIIDAGMDESVSYKDIVMATAKLLKRSPILIDVPYVSPHLSKLWVRLVSGAPKDLVYPLIDSVRHEMLKNSSRQIPKEWGIQLTGLAQAIGQTFKETFAFSVPRLLTSVRDLSEVRSIQRLPLPAGKSAQWVADRYFSWLPLALKMFLKVERTADTCSYRLRIFNLQLLRLQKDAANSRPDRQVFNVADGALVSRENHGHFEFRESHDQKYMIVALHNFRPALPWPLYRYTQAVIHRLLMRSFGRNVAGSMST